MPDKYANQAAHMAVAYNAGYAMKKNGWKRRNPYVKSCNYYRAWWAGWFAAEREGETDDQNKTRKLSRG